MMAMPLYIEVLIKASLDDLWHRTQDPACHQRWDARFTRITYLPSVETGSDGNEGPTPPADGAARSHGQPTDGAEVPRLATRFGYATRVFPGQTISGSGITINERLRDDGTRTSALRFSSPDRRSPIRRGTGYWRYIPTASGVRFLTGYQYTPGWGWFGRPADLLVRPLLGWATAWSFDRLRLWSERGISPRRALVHAWCEIIARFAVITVAAALDKPLAMLASILAIAIPPTPWTPAARRCLRTPPDNAAGRAPAIATTLEDR